MPNQQNSNVDEDLRQRVGHDATSSFESDPRFTDSNPTVEASSENLGATRSSGDESLSGNTDRRPNALENDEGPSLEEDDESAVDPDTGYDSRELTLESEDEEDASAGDDSNEDSNVNATGDLSGSKDASQDETRLEAGAQSARGRGSRKSPRQAA